MFARLPNIVGSSATPIYWHFKSINSLTEKLHSRFSRHFKVPKVFKFSDGKTASYTLAAGFGTPVQLLTHEIMFVASKFAAYVNSADHPPLSPLPSSSSSAAYLVAELTGAQGERRVNTRENTYIGKYFPLLSF